MRGGETQIDLILEFLETNGFSSLEQAIGSGNAENRYDKLKATGQE